FCPDAPERMRAWRPPTATRAALLLALLQLLGPARFAVLLDLRLGQILVLGADHAEHRRRPVCTTRNGAKLNRPFTALSNDDAAPDADRAAPVERMQRSLTCARNDLRLDHRRQLVDELLHDFLKI